MQQMAGNMSLLNPFVFNQFGPYGAYAQVGYISRFCIDYYITAAGHSFARNQTAPNFDV